MYEEINANYFQFQKNKKHTYPVQWLGAPPLLIHEETSERNSISEYLLHANNTTGQGAEVHFKLDKVTKLKEFIIKFTDKTDNNKKIEV